MQNTSPSFTDAAHEGQVGPSAAGALSGAGILEASVTHEMIGGAITLSVTMERYIIPVDAADPEPVIQLIPTYTDDLAKITYYQLPNFAPSGSTYAIDREDFQVL